MGEPPQAGASRCTDPVDAMRRCGEMDRRGGRERQAEARERAVASDMPRTCGFVSGKSGFNRPGPSCPMEEANMTTDSPCYICPSCGMRTFIPDEVESRFCFRCQLLKEPVPAQGVPTNGAIPVPVTWSCFGSEAGRLADDRRDETQRAG